jgi:hypothetical protein
MLIVGHELVRERRRTRRADQFVASLRLPDEPPPPTATRTGLSIVCTTEGRSYPDVTLTLLSGESVQPRFPHDSCGRVRAEVWSAYQSTQFDEVLEHVVVQHMPRPSPTP